MKAIPFLFTVSLISLASIGQSSNDIDAVKKVVSAFQDDSNDGSFKNASEYTTADIEVINPGGGILKGRDSVLAALRFVHQMFLKGVLMKTESMYVRFVTPDVAIADVVSSLTTYTTPDGIKHENERHIHTYVVVKQKGKWLLAHDQSTVIQSPNTPQNRN